MRERYLAYKLRVPEGVYPEVGEFMGNYSDIKKSANTLPGQFAEFKDYHAGETVIVCGCGRSLTQLSHPEKTITIGVNDVGRQFDPDYLVVLNPRNQFKGDRFRFVENSRARALFTQLSLGIRHANIVRFRLGKRGGTDCSDPTSLPFTRNSPYVALCLAMYMGAKRIGLIGVDFTEHHFFGQTGKHSLASKFTQINEEYIKIADAARRVGVEIVNLSNQSRLTAFPKVPINEFIDENVERLDQQKVVHSLNIISYSTTPVAGVPAILSRCVDTQTVHKSRCVWATNDYGNGVHFQGDVQWKQSSALARELIESADVIVAHNGRVAPEHKRVMETKAVITMAHNYMWNVDQYYVQKGFPGVVVGQYQATLPEFKNWSVVPNPIPLWESTYQPLQKNEQITICYTPSGKHESYPKSHRLYWHAKGYDTTMRILDRLARIYPVRLEVIRDRQLSHAEVLAMKQRSHIVIDECFTGSYHRNSLEGLAAGCVVVNGVGILPEVVDVFQYCARGTDYNPFVFSDLNRLEQVLIEVIESGSQPLLQQGRRNRVWMETHWNFQNQWTKFWEPLCSLAYSTVDVGKNSHGLRLEHSNAGDKRKMEMPKKIHGFENFNAGYNQKRGYGEKEAMDKPPNIAISVVLPAHASAAELVLRTLLSLNSQTFPVQQYEVIVSADGGDSKNRLKEIIEAVSWRFQCTLVESIRTHGDLPHRNHTRNAGCAVAKGVLIWPLDADFLLPEHALAQLWREYTRLKKSSRSYIFTPCLAAISIEPQLWIDRTADAVSNNSATQLLDIAGQSRLDKTLQSGFANYYKLNASASRKINHLGEGMPVIPSNLLRALGGFDEAFIGWGGNKQELVSRLRGLARAGLIEFRVLNNVLALHQPHAWDADKTKDSPLRNKNADRLMRKDRDIRNNADWWRREKAAALAALKEDPRKAEKTISSIGMKKSSKRTIRVGLLSVGDSRKGLFRDTEVLIWALEKGNATTKDQFSMSIFPVGPEPTELQSRVTAAKAVKFANAVPGVRVAPMGTRFTKWLTTVDVIVISESWLPAAIAYARKQGKRVVYIPNLDWSAIGGSTERWITEVRNSDIEVWAKTAHTQEILRKHNISSKRVSWSIPDPVNRNRIVSDRPLKLLFLAGMGGWHDRRGMDIVLTAFELAREVIPELKLLLHSIKPLDSYQNTKSSSVKGIQYSEGLLSRSHVFKLYEEADLLLYPSRWEGFGLSLLEGLHAGLPVIATNGPPMNELVEHGHNGLLVSSQYKGNTRLAPWYECSPAAVADAIVHLSNNFQLRRRLTCPEPSQWIARQHRFTKEVAALLSNQPRTRVVVLSDQQLESGPRRSELYWADALRTYGFDVDTITMGGDQSISTRVFIPKPRFVLVGKVSKELVTRIKSLTTAPVILWHHDLVDYSVHRDRWFKSVVPICDLVAIPESGRELVPGYQHKIFRLFPGAKVDGNRGTGRRPILDVNMQNNEIVFLGRLDPLRRKLLMRCQAVAPVRVYTEEENPSLDGIMMEPAVWGEEATRVISQSAFVLSISARNDINYTSNRLFNSAGSGGCVLVQSFPGLDQLYPKECVEAFNDPNDAVSSINSLQKNHERCRELRIAGEEYTWRNHTWLDRIGELLRRLEKLSEKRTTDDNVPYENSMVKYWDDRAQKRGACAAGYFRWQTRDFEDATIAAWNMLRKHATDAGFPNMATALDFGCGPGRFTKRLAALGPRITAVDISETMLTYARTECAGIGCEFTLIRPGCALPFADDCLDALWTYTVLQHIPDSLFSFTISEIRRVLKPGALILIYENTYKHIKRTSESGHVVFRRPEEYEKAFPGTKVRHHNDIKGERHSLIIGRLQGESIIKSPKAVSTTMD